MILMLKLSQRYLFSVIVRKNSLSLSTTAIFLSASSLQSCQTLPCVGEIFILLSVAVLPGKSWQAACKVGYADGQQSEAKSWVPAFMATPKLQLRKKHQNYR